MRGNGLGGSASSAAISRVEDRAARGVLVAQIDVDVVDADRPRGDQHAFEEAVRIALQIIAILERARLAFVDVDGHQPRRGLGAHDLPLAADRKPGAAQAAQARILHGLDHVVDPPLAVHAREVGGVSARRAIRVVVDVARQRQARFAFRRSPPARLPASRGRSDCGRQPLPGHARIARCTARR